MNTDTEKANDIDITSQGPLTITSHSLSHPEAIVAFIRVISLSLSVFICVHLRFHSIYPTDAS